MLRRRRRLWAAAAISIALLLVLASVRVVVIGPRVHLTWQAAITPADRLALEQKHDLRNGRAESADGLTWRYELGDWSREAVADIVHEPAVTDTRYIDRTRFIVDAPTRSVESRITSLPFPFSTDNRFESLWFFFHLQSLCVIAVGAVLLAGARIHDERRRQTLVISALLAFGIAAQTLPLSPTFLRMADANMYTKDRRNFETGLAEIRFESHLKDAVLKELYPAFGSGEDAPERTFAAFTRIVTAWFVICALAAGVIERWSPQVVRYLALTVLAPSSLLYFGHRDFAFLCLNAATFPLLARGLSEGRRRLAAGSALTGLGAAFHGFGLLSLIGAWIGSLLASGSFVARVERVLQVTAWATAGWLGWIAVYMIALDLPLDAGRAGSSSWRPLFVDEVGNRVNAAIFTPAGIRDVLMSAWMVGVPLLVLGVCSWRRYRDQVLVMIGYAMPSLLFLVFFWPVQGLGVDTGHVFAAFPAFYAAAWLCAREPRYTAIAAAVLISAHLAFWRVVLDTRFVNDRLGP
jgi:hypothetical protein